MDFFALYNSIRYSKCLIQIATTVIRLRTTRGPENNATRDRYSAKKYLKNESLIFTHLFCILKT